MKWIAELLAKTYPDAHCELTYATPLQLLVATILSAQCTDVRVNLVTPGLFRTYRDATAFARAPLRDLEQAIRSTGFFRNKAKNIQGACRMLLERYGGKVPRTMEELIELPGVARKTANVVLGNAYGVSAGIAVDTHVLRLSARLGLSKEKTPEKVEQDLMRLYAPEEWTVLGHRIIWHGRRVCFARSPKCGECPLATLCPSAGKI